MLDPKVIDLAGKLIQVEFQERRQQLSREIEFVHNEMAERGFGRSGVALARIRELCSREVEILARIVWQMLLRVISSIGLEPSETLAQELKAEVERYLPSDLPELTQIVKKQAYLVRIEQTPSTLNEARTHALNRVGVEIDLFVHSLISRAQAKEGEAVFPAPVIHIHSPVGVIQTGPGATANVLQDLGIEGRDELLRVLRLISERLAALPELPGSSKEEVLELVKEGLTEIQKAKPNAIRLRSILTAVGPAIQNVGTLYSAYQALKAVALLLGISLS
ncbi:MAG: hypothetical protein O6929_06980 [candidate division NC10 bacterium]|nr:hypothetical protein [candidate division NC10 bacterium]